jgi:hypothetical protein
MNLNSVLLRDTGVQAAKKLFSRKYAVPIFLAVSIGMFNQLSGINAIFCYLNDIFAHAGFSRISGNLQAVAIVPKFEKYRLIL